MNNLLSFQADLLRYLPVNFETCDLIFVIFSGIFNTRSLFSAVFPFLMTIKNNSSEEPKLAKNEYIKQESNLLRGTISEGLLDDSTGALASDDTQLTKFHGIYQQDDRDVRKERRKAKLEPAYSFMTLSLIHI